MNESQPHASNIKDNTISNTANETGFNFEKYDPYVDVLRTLFVPSVDKRICELLELFYTDKATVNTPSYWERCLEIVSAIKYEVGVVQSYLKQAFYYFANSGLVNCVTNSLLLSNRVEKVCRDIDRLGEKNLRRYVNAWNFVNEKSYWRVSTQFVSITSKKLNCSGSFPEAEVGSTSSAYPTSNSNPGSSLQKYKNVRKFPKRSTERFSRSNSENSSYSISSFPSKCEESSPNDDNERKLKVLIGDSQNLKYSEIRKLSVPCKCENLIRHFVKTDFVESPSSIEAKKKLEKVLKNTCFSLNQILEPMDSNDVHKCQLLWKLQENYMKIQLKKQENNGDKTCLFTERIDISKKDLSVMRNRSVDLEDISEKMNGGSSKSIGSEKLVVNCGPNEIKNNNFQLLENNSNSNHSQSMENGSKVVKNDLTLMKRNSVTIKDSFDLNQSDLRDSKDNIVTSTKIHDTDIPKWKNKCLDRKYCENLRGNLCRCSGQCFCDLDSFDDDYTTARTSIKSWGSSVKCDSENSCDCSPGNFVGSVVENKNCSGEKCGNDDDDENCCGSKGSKIDIYIKIDQNGDQVSRQSQDAKAKKSISVQTIKENLELRSEESDRKSEDSGSIFWKTSSLFEALNTIAEENCNCNEKIVACPEEQLIDFGDSSEKNDSAEDSCGCEEINLPDIPKNQSITKIAEGFVRNMVNQIEGSNLNIGNNSLEGSSNKTEDCNCSINSVKELSEKKESNFENETYRTDCNCSVYSGSLKDIKEERKESTLTNEKHDDDCNCSTYSGSLAKIKMERKESSSKNENDEDHGDDYNCSTCSDSLAKIKMERQESSSKNENDEDHGDDYNCSICSDSLEKVKMERKESSSKNENDEDHGDVYNCSTCSDSLEKVKMERKESSSKNENDENHGDDCNCLLCSISSQEIKLERKKSGFTNEKPENDCTCSTYSVSSQETKRERKKSMSEDKKHGTECWCSVYSISVQEMKLEMRKSFEEKENVEQIEENLQEGELEEKSSGLIGLFQAEMQEFAERKSKISESTKEVVDEIKAPVESQADEKEVIEGSEGCGCTVDSDDIFISAQSVFQKSAVKIEVSKDRGNLSPIVEAEYRPVEFSEPNPTLPNLDFRKVEQVFKTEEVEEKFKAEKSEKRKSSSEKIQLKEPKIVSSESSTSETCRSVPSNVSKISRSSVSLAEANCGSSSYYRSNFCLHNVYLSCDCSKAGQFSKSSVPKRTQNYQTINTDKLRRCESRSQINVCAMFSAMCRKLHHCCWGRTFQKFKHVIRMMEAYWILKHRDKATSTSDLPFYTRHYHKSSRKNLSKFSLNHEYLCLAHKKDPTLYHKNNEAKIPCPFLGSTKQHKEVINQRKQSHCYCSRPKNVQPLRKSNSCSLNNNCKHNFKKRLSDTSFSTYSQMSRIDYFFKNGPGDSEFSNLRCDSNYNKKIRAAEQLADYLEALWYSKIKQYNKYRTRYCNYCRESLEEDIERLNNLLRRNKNLGD